MALHRCSVREMLPDIAKVGAGLIAVDGWHGSGKSYLARAASVCLDVPRFDLDSALKRAQDGFVDHLNFARIASVIATSPRLILSGICMREVLDRLGRPLVGMHIYVQRMHHGHWTHEGEATGSASEYERVDQACPPCALEIEVRAYHAKWRPHEQADVILKRPVSRRTGL
jgi:hypothetical protein